MTFATYALQVDGRSLPPVRAVVEQGRALVPVRVMSDALGASITYDASTRTVVVQRASRAQRIAAARVVNGRTYAPLRAVADALGVPVRYDATRRTIALAGVTRVASALERGAVQPTPAPPVATPEVTGAVVQPISPRPGAAVDNAYPTMTAHVLGTDVTVDTSSVAMTLDGVALDAAVIGDMVTATARTAVPPGAHTVALSGTDARGARFSTTWSFTETASVSQRSLPYVRPLEQVYVDRFPAPGERTFDVVAYGAPGANGYITIDGVPGAFSLFPTSGTQYVAHVLLPEGIVQPYARVNVHLSPLTSAPFTYTLPTVFSIQTGPATPQPVTATPIAGGPRHTLRSATTPMPAVTPVATPVPLAVPRHQASPRPRASASPKSRVPS